MFINSRLPVSLRFEVSHSDRDRLPALPLSSDANADLILNYLFSVELQVNYSFNMVAIDSIPLSSSGDSTDPLS